MTVTCNNVSGISRLGCEELTNGALINTFTSTDYTGEALPPSAYVYTYDVSTGDDVALT
jgi:hypothetical protein